MAYENKEKDGSSDPVVGPGPRMAACYTTMKDGVHRPDTRPSGPLGVGNDEKEKPE